jgi:hypothetical protein
MKIDRGRLNWGVFFIILGAVPLAYHQGVVSASSVQELWRLWPLVLVGLGLGIVLSRTPAFFVGGLVVAATLGLVVGSLFAVGPDLGCTGSGDARNYVDRSGSFDGSARVNLNLQCGVATVSPSSDGQWHVNTSTTGSNPARISSTSGLLSVDSGQPDWGFDRSNATWAVSLPTQTQIDLDVSVDAGDATFNLNGVRLSSARFSVNAGSMRVDLSGASVSSFSLSTNVGSASLTLDGDSDISGSVSTNLGSLELCVPPSLGLQIRSSSSLSSDNLAARGLVRVGDLWQTQNYATASHKADLNASTSLGSLDLSYAGGCK